MKRKNFKVLVVGCGSVGTRHIKNLLPMPECKKIFIYTKRRDCLINFARHKGKIVIIRSLKGIAADFAIIANQTHKHLKTALLLAEKRIDLFIEKPVSHSLDGLEKLESIVKKNRLKALVAYNLRFLAAMQSLKIAIARKLIGKPYFARIEVGQYLPTWRKNIDYRDNYGAHRNQGGGVALDLSHEVDYMRYLFGEPLRWRVFKAKVSDLKIDTEDIFEGLYTYRNGFVCSVHMDYLQRQKTRTISITGEKGVISCDFIKKETRISKYAGKEIVYNEKEDFDVDKSFVNELSQFMGCLTSNRNPAPSIKDGFRTLKLLEDSDV